MKKLCLILVVVGILLFAVGIQIGFSFSYVVYFNVDTQKIQDHPNPSTIKITIYPNAWLGTLICIAGAVIALSGIIWLKKQ